MCSHCPTAPGPAPAKRWRDWRSGRFNGCLVATGFSEWPLVSLALEAFEGACAIITTGTLLARMNSLNALRFHERLHRDLSRVLSADGRDADAVAARRPDPWFHRHNFACCSNCRRARRAGDLADGITISANCLFERPAAFWIAPPKPRTSAAAGRGGRPGPETAGAGGDGLVRRRRRQKRRAKAVNDRGTLKSPAICRKTSEQAAARPAPSENCRARTTMFSSTVPPPYIFRAYSPALRRSEPASPTDCRSTPCSACAICCGSCCATCRRTDYSRTHLAIVFDKSRSLSATSSIQLYKAHRPPAPDDLIPQFPLIREAVRAFDLPCPRAGPVWRPTDTIATYAANRLQRGATATIVSSDKDLMQLVTDGVTMWNR